MYRKADSDSASSIMRTDEAAKTQHWQDNYGLVEGPNNPEPVDLEDMRM
jgi:hypothetical protein